MSEREKARDFCIASTNSRLTNDSFTCRRTKETFRHTDTRADRQSIILLRERRRDEERVLKREDV